MAGGCPVVNVGRLVGSVGDARRMDSASWMQPGIRCSYPLPLPWHGALPGRLFTSPLPCKPSMISNSFHMSIRSGHRASAPSLSSSVTPSDGQGKRRRRRGKRGGKKRKHRAGVRRNQLKSERLAKSHLRVMYWNCRSLEQRGVVAEKLAYSCDILCLHETKLGQR